MGASRDGPHVECHAKSPSRSPKVDDRIVWVGLLTQPLQRLLGVFENVPGGKFPGERKRDGAAGLGSGKDGPAVRSFGIELPELNVREQLRGRLSAFRRLSDGAADVRAQK